MAAAVRDAASGNTGYRRDRGHETWPVAGRDVGTDAGGNHDAGLSICRFDTMPRQCVACRKQSVVLSVQRVFVWSDALPNKTNMRRGDNAQQDQPDRGGGRGGDGVDHCVRPARPRRPPQHPVLAGVVDRQSLSVRRHQGHPCGVPGHRAAGPLRRGGQHGADARRRDPHGGERRGRRGSAQHYLDAHERHHLVRRHPADRARRGVHRTSTASTKRAAATPARTSRT